MKVCEIEISKVYVSERLREELGDIRPLARSIESLGLLNPITVSAVLDRYKLLAGERRLEACKSLGYKTIDARIVDNALGILRLEVSDFENSCEICDYPVTDVCHLIPRQHGGPNHPLNLARLCPNHHRVVDFLVRHKIRQMFKADEEKYFQGKNSEQRTKDHLRYYAKVENYDKNVIKWFDERVEDLLPVIKVWQQNLVSELREKSNGKV
jgi:hypothetical protein